MPWPSRSAGLPGRLGIAALFLVTVPPALDGPTALAAPQPARVAAPPLASRPFAFTPSTGPFESTLRRRLEHEARRQKLGLDMPYITTPGDDVEGFEPERNRRVERTILRALRGAIDERLEEAARGSASFAPLFRWLDGRDDGTQGWSAGPSAAPRAESVTTFLTDAPPAPAPRGVGDFALRFRLDAHPRLLLGARLGAVNGRIELPLLERELRLSLDRPIGDHGRASLRGGRSAERGDWADLALHFRF